MSNIQWFHMVASWSELECSQSDWRSGSVYLNTLARWSRERLWTSILEVGH